MEDIERTAADIVRGLIEAEARGDEKTTLVLGPYAAYMIITTIQLATRHPDVGEPLKEQLRDIARQFESMFAGLPAGELLALGWDPRYDR